MIDLSRERWAGRCASMRVVSARDNTFIYRQGERCAHVYVIARGHIKLSRVTAGGVIHAMIILPAGDVCGAPLTGETMPQAHDTATAKGTVQIYRIPLWDLMAVLSTDMELAEFIIKRLAKRQCFLERRIEQLLSSDVSGRVVAMLFELTGDYGGRCAHGHEIDIRLTQQELAEMAGTSRPTVSTILNRLREQGVISYTRHYICINSLQALEDIAGRR